MQIYYFLCFFFNLGPLVNANPGAGQTLDSSAFDVIESVLNLFDVERRRSDESTIDVVVVSGLKHYGQTHLATGDKRQKPAALWYS